jgi:hypothetical protein
MVTRGEAKVFKPKRQDAFDLCAAFFGTQCGCRSAGANPCWSWRAVLLDCFIHGWKDPVSAERHRIRYNRRYGTFYPFPSNTGYHEENP